MTKLNYRVCNIIALRNEDSEIRQWADYIISVTDEYSPFADIQIDCLDRCDEDGPTLEDMDKVLEFVNEIPEGSNVVIHCSAGISLTNSFLLYILMAYEDMNYIDAYQEMRNIRPIAHPNRKVIKIIDEEFNLSEKLVDLNKQIVFDSFIKRN